MLIEYLLVIFEPKTVQHSCGTQNLRRPKGTKAAAPAENPTGGCVRMEIHNGK
jgi:hypothetical protein